MLGRILSLPTIAIDLIRSLYGTRHEQSEETMEKRDASRQANWKYIAWESGQHLADHFRAFGDVTPYPHNNVSNPEDIGHVEIINDETMYTAFIKDAKFPDPLEARRLASASMILPYLGNARGVSGHYYGIKGTFSPYDHSKSRHAYSTGFYDKYGYFNYTQFKGIVDFATNDARDGKAVISRADMQNYINHLEKSDKRWENVNPIDALIGKIAKKGEYDKLFDIINTRWVVVGNEVVPHALVTDIKRWLTKTASVLKDKREGHMELPPKPQKDLIDKALDAACQFAAKHYVPGYGPQPHPNAFFTQANNRACIYNSSVAPAIAAPAPVGLLGR